MDEYTRLARVMKQANQRELDARLALRAAEDHLKIEQDQAQHDTQAFMEAHKRWIESL